MSMRITPTFICFLLFISCGSKSNHLPASTGQPYEVVLEGDTDSIVTKILTENVPALPQPEPLCNVIQVKKGKARGSYLLMRTRITVDIDYRHKGFSVKTTQDENASPQTIIRIKAKSAEQLRAMFYDKNGMLNKNSQQIRDFIDQQELKHLVSLIKQNPEKQRVVKRMFGIDMKISAAIDASKKGKGFLWLSNNASTGMQNIIIFRLNGTGTSNTEVEGGTGWNYDRQEINKVLRAYIPGETDQMYMQLTQAQENMVGEMLDDSNPYAIHCMWARGLWEMKGDAMGGPYILRCIPMSKGKTIAKFGQQTGKIDSRIVIIAFVYAPEMKKRNLTKQLEAALTTIN